MFTGLLAGYLLGTVLGFMLWHPDRDMWALLGFVLAIVGLFAGLTPFFRHHLGVALLAIAGFYVGVLLGIVLFATPSETTMIDALPATRAGWQARSLAQ